MERDDKISREWTTQWVSIFANQKRKPEPPSPTRFNSATGTDTDTTEIDLAVARFRVWFVLDGVTIHRREIPGNEKFEGFCSQMESLFYNPESKFDVSQFEYVLIAKKRDGNPKAEPFTGSSSYQRMKNELLENKSPWRHAIVRRNVTVLSALESYVKMRPMVDSYQPPVPSLMLAPPQLYFRWTSQDRHGSSPPSQTAMMPSQQPTHRGTPFQTAESPPIQSSLPIRTHTQVPTGPSHLPAHTAPPLYPPSSFGPTPLEPSPLKWIRPKGPGRDLSQSPMAFKKPSSGVNTFNRKASGQILRSPTTGPSRRLLSSPRAPSPESIVIKRHRLLQPGPAPGHEALPTSPFARLQVSVTKPTAEIPSTLALPINSTDENAAQRATTGQIHIPAQRKRKFINLRVSKPDGNED